MTRNHPQADRADIEKLLPRLQRLYVAGLSRQEVAAEARVSQSTVSKVSNPDKHTVTHAMYVAVAEGVKRLERKLREDRRLVPELPTVESERKAAETVLDLLTNIPEPKPNSTLEAALIYVKGLHPTIRKELIDFLIWQREYEARSR
jgi:transcriptional regulator with XRE-family HTH domain